jgi:hypothetical protein
MKRLALVAVALFAVAACAKKDAAATDTTMAAPAAATDTAMKMMDSSKAMMDTAKSAMDSSKKLADSAKSAMKKP